MDEYVKNGGRNKFKTNKKIINLNAEKYIKYLFMKFSKIRIEDTVPGWPN